MGTYEDARTYHRKKQEQLIRQMPAEDEKGMPMYTPDKPFKDKIGKRFIFECPRCNQTNVVIAKQSSGFQNCICQHCSEFVRVRI